MENNGKPGIAHPVLAILVSFLAKPMDVTVCQHRAQASYFSKVKSTLPELLVFVISEYDHKSYIIKIAWKWSLKASNSCSELVADYQLLNVFPSTEYY
jgi:hypothetical protein